MYPPTYTHKLLKSTNTKVVKKKSSKNEDMPQRTRRLEVYPNIDVH